MLELAVPIIGIPSITVPVLVVPNTRYAARVPVIIGTNVINYCRCCSTGNDIPVEWGKVFSTLSSGNVTEVRVFKHKAVTLRSHKAVTYGGHITVT